MEGAALAGASNGCWRAKEILHSATRRPVAWAGGETPHPWHPGAPGTEGLWGWSFPEGHQRHGVMGCGVFGEEVAQGDLRKV